MMSSEQRKCRTLYLADPQQVERAASLLRHGFDIRVLAMPELSRLMLVYELQPLCSLARILARLEAARIELAGRWWQQLQQRLICYGEAVQLQQRQER
ncbi:hypothetical protein [Vogesella sp. LIG4]|uniref:hypothetical protein n=1 Tax=Vogesella sp. LIG4 TaxID=1192162 RepID=UPI00081FED15|nr:hypothetical protein [Vogesella sp. LIG4]SCK06402.1 hypothetical protein PSELUDRAFT_0241 [Vogesella sp. LIG4]